MSKGRVTRYGFNNIKQHEEIAALRSQRRQERHLDSSKPTAAKLASCLCEERRDEAISSAFLKLFFSLALL